jgi:hypothetical protein
MGYKDVDERVFVVLDKAENATEQELHRQQEFCMMHLLS